jgi:hypothetical protein
MTLKQLWMHETGAQDQTSEQYQSFTSPGSTSLSRDFLSLYSLHSDVLICVFK